MLDIIKANIVAYREAVIESQRAVRAAIDDPSERVIMEIYPCREREKERLNGLLYVIKRALTTEGGE